MSNVMVDLETLGSVPGCAILAIGAVAFDAGGLGPTKFYTVVSRSSCEKIGLHEDEATLAWWSAQSSEAQAVLSQADKGIEALAITDALEAFNRFVSITGSDVKLWGNGADFDNAILAAAMRAAGLAPSWKFYNNRCYRTLKNLRRQVRLDRTGVHHNALDDAISQANHAIRLLAA